MIYIWVFWYILHVFRRQLSSLKPFWIQMFLIWRKIVWKASRVPDVSTSRIMELVEVNKIFQILRRNLDFAKLDRVTRRVFLKYTMREKYPYSKLFRFTFSRIRTEYSVSLRIKSECGKIRTRITPNTDTFCEWQEDT